MVYDADLDAYRAWKSAPAGAIKDQAMTRLLQQLGGAIQSATNVYRTAPLPRVTMELESKRIAVQAITEWKEDGGQGLASYVGTMIRQRMFRYVSEHQNVGRIPEEQVRRIGGLYRATEYLTDKHGREPTGEELADHLGLPLKTLSRLRKSLRKSFLESASDYETMDDYTNDPDYERAMLGYYSLTDQEKLVFDYLMGAHGKPKSTPGEIAKKLKVTPARVSNIKENIGNKLSVYLRPAA